MPPAVTMTPAGRRPAKAHLASTTAPGAGQREPLPVLPDPVPRGGERAASRWGPLGEGAEPVFRRSARFRDFTTTRPWPRSPATLTG